MKPLKLEMSAFGSYAGLVEVDFTKAGSCNRGKQEWQNIESDPITVCVLPFLRERDTVMDLQSIWEK